MYTRVKTISPYIHRCVVREGPSAGNKVRTEVYSWDPDWPEHCEFCDEPLVTNEQLLAHIYNELLGDGA